MSVSAQGRPGRSPDPQHTLAVERARPAGAIGPHPAMVGRSAAFSDLDVKIRRIALTEAPVLIEGETGSGKELAARAIHYLGARRDKPFIPLNCGAIPDNLVEAELFGHVRGAFTDAKGARVGLIGQANGGTLFLDEIDALCPRAQVALLRFLQDRRYRRVGHDEEQFCDARIIAASNRALRELVASGGFRGDLMYRLDILALHIPPLRERIEDIEPLAQHCVQRFCLQYGLGPKRLHGDTLAWMLAHDWPGNVRELENLVHREVLLADGPEIVYRGDADATALELARSPRPGPPDVGALDFHHAKARAIAEFERAYLARLLARTGGNVSAAARLAHKERRALGKLMKKHNIDRLRFRD